MEKIDKAIEIFQAFKEGKIIEYESCKGWQNFTGSAWNLLQCISNIKNFRVKQQPTYRPYVSSEEFLKASKEHGGFISLLYKGKKDDTGYFPKCVSKDNVHLSMIQASYSFNGLLKCCVWTDDGTPCGILEQ